MNQLVLSLFPGIDLFGRGFEEEGFCVVRGPDLIFGGDVVRFNAPAGRFDGVIGGSPCPDFSRARRGVPSGDGIRMLGEFRRVVEQARPAWWLLENVPGCPDLRIDGYGYQRIDLDARDVGMRQRRLRHFQFGHVDGVPLVLPRTSSARTGGEATCVAVEAGKSDRRDWSTFCELQGLPRSFELPSFTLSARYRAVGNGVPVPMACFLARAVLGLGATPEVRLCECGCARPVDGRAMYAGVSCRKRAQRKRDGAGVTGGSSVTVTDLV
ncbi:DNA cytosine methyltransferase [Burkholderia alba]|uniref:DNA cytosine methyltransferase n=1 Tax=Burkholderia alba TaxID=2683677 RepID=UPI002B054A12|nr:DNA cytosine methyltransferase [Burkholderia alba]